jgi:hypothetical protein
MRPDRQEAESPEKIHRDGEVHKYYWAKKGLAVERTHHWGLCWSVPVARASAYEEIGFYNQDPLPHSPTFGFTVCLSLSLVSCFLPHPQCRVYSLLHSKVRPWQG